jgi:hypothetical protein
MSSKHTGHIEEQRLIKILVDGIQPTGTEDEHLAQCPQCGTVMEDLQADLKNLRRASVLFTPKLEKRLTLPASVARPAGIRGLGRGWRVAAGAVATLCLAAVVWWQAGVWRLNTHPPEIATLPVPVASDPLMRETRMLADNAIPETYQAIIESLDGGFDEGFIEFVIPPLDEDSLS